MAAPAADGGAAANGQVAAPAAVAAAGAAQGNPNAAQEGAERAVKLFDINQPITIALAKAGQYPELEGMVPSDLMKPANPHELRSVTSWLKERATSARGCSRRPTWGTPQSATGLQWG